MDVFVRSHSIKWWKEHGAKCPDCGEGKITPRGADYTFLERKTSLYYDVKYRQDFECRLCSCEFVVIEIVENAVNKADSGRLFD